MLKEIYKEIIELDLDKLESGEANPRKNYSDEEIIDTLQNSIKFYGQQEPIQVKPLENGRYLIKDGKRRVIALRNLHDKFPEDERWARVKAVLIEKSRDDMDLLFDNFIDLEHRRDISIAEKGMAIKKLLDSKKMTEIELANRIGRTKDWIRDCLRVAGLAEDIGKEVFMGPQRLSEEHAKKLEKKVPKEKRKELATKLVQLPPSQRIKAINLVEENPEKPIDEVIEEAKHIRGGGVLKVEIKVKQTTYDFYTQHAQERNWKSSVEDYISFLLENVIPMLQLAGRFGRP